jgi:hypothetical protein
MPTLQSIASFLTTIRDMTVTGVERYYKYPPASVDIASGYCAFPLMGGTTRGEQVSTCIEQSKTRTLGYVIVIEAVGQDTQEGNYDKLAAATDNLETALDALAPDTVNFIEYETSWTGEYIIGGQAYWAVVASITVRSL